MLYHNLAYRTCDFPFMNYFILLLLDEIMLVHMCLRSCLCLGFMDMIEAYAISLLYLLQLWYVQLIIWINCYYEFLLSCVHCLNYQKLSPIMLIGSKYNGYWYSVTWGKGFICMCSLRNSHWLYIYTWSVIWCIKFVFPLCMSLMMFCRCS